MTRRASWLGFAVAAAAAVVLLVHVAGWLAAVAGLWRGATLHVPRVQSAIVLGAGLLVVRAAASSRLNVRRLVLSAALVGVFVACVTVPLPQEFEGNGFMQDGLDNSGDRDKFERRFPVTRGPTMSFHSHLGDLLMARLDRAFGGQGESSARAYAAISRIGGLLFVLELLVVAVWHNWSPRICRYAGLALASPLSLLFFGFWELGYLSLGAGVVPLLALGTSRHPLRAAGATLGAGLLQGLHSALHGFGLIGLAGGAMWSFIARGETAARLVRTLTFAAAGVAMYLGWVFVYVVGMKLSIVVDGAVKGFSGRGLFEPAIIDQRIAYPLFSQLGLGEVGVISMLAGVPLLVLALVKTPLSRAVPALAFAVPGLAFLMLWWPPGAPYNLDLLFAAFPGMLAACWLLASTRARTTRAYVLMALLHVLFWTVIGSTAFGRVWVEPVA